MTTRRDLVIGLALDGREFTRGATKAERDTMRLERGIRDFGSRSQWGFNKASRGMLELSRGAEDFFVSFSTGGVAGGMRGAANNISQFASMIHPLAGAVAGLAVAGATAWLAFNKGADEAIKKTETINDKIKDVFGDRHELRLREFSKTASREDFEAQLSVARGELTDIEAQRKLMESARARAEETAESRRFHVDRLARLRGMLEQEQEGTTPGRRGPASEDTIKGLQLGIEDALKKSREAIELDREAQKEFESRSRAFQLSEARLGTGAQQEAAGINLQRSEFRKSLEERRKAAEMRRREFEELRRQRFFDDPRGGLGRGALTGLHLPVGVLAPRDAASVRAPQFASGLLKGSREASQAIAQAKNQADIQKEQLKEQKAMREALDKISKDMQGDVILESFSGVA